MYKYTIEKQSDIDFLKRDGKTLFCPFRNPLVLPGKIAQELQISKETCNSSCPHFNKMQKDNQTTIYITCGSGNGKDYLIEPETKSFLDVVK